MSANGKINEIGGMRLALWLFAIATYPMVFFADMEPEGIGIFTAYIVPALVVLFFFVLLLDTLMNRVFMIEQEANVVRVRRIRMWLSLAVVAGLLLFWLPYYRDLASL